jgi:hypothetical protein
MRSRRPNSNVDGVRVEDGFTPLFAQADRAAVAAQRRYLRLTFTGLILAVIAAIGSALSADTRIGGQSVDLGGVLSGLAFLLGTILGLYLLIAKPEQIWYENRAVAESVKTLCWQYAVGGGAFAHTDDPAAALGAEVRDIVHHMQHSGLLVTAGNDEVTPEMRQVRALPAPERRRLYLVQRLEDQNGYYAAQALRNRKLANGWFAAAIGLQAVGVLLAVLKAINVVDADLLGIAATAAAGALAWVQTRDCQNLAESYRVTANELADITAEAKQLEDATLADRWGPFVRGAEQAISREHTLWRARRVA